MKYTISILVIGTGAFPIDMLRYSRLYPATSLAVELITESLGTFETIDDFRKSRRIYLYGDRHSGGDLMNAVERFESFGWKAEIRQQELVA